MPRNMCVSQGQRPDGSACDAFDKTSWSCTAETCQNQHIHLTDEEREQMERVNTPSAIERVKSEMSRRPDLFMMLNDDIFRPVQLALTIIEKMSPLSKVEGGASPDNQVRTYADMGAYWDSSIRIEQDLGMLAALHAQIVVIAARLRANSVSVDQSLKTMSAEKYLVVKRSYQIGIRPGQKPTEEELKSQVRVAPEIQEALSTQGKASMQAEIMQAFAGAIIEYINVLKKRLDYAREERKQA